MQGKSGIDCQATEDARDAKEYATRESFVLTLKLKTLKNFYNQTLIARMLKLLI